MQNYYRISSHLHPLPFSPSLLLILHNCKQSQTGGDDSLGMRLQPTCSSVALCVCDPVSVCVFLFLSEITQILADVAEDPTLPRTDDHSCPK